MVLMGINRIIITDGRISAKPMYDFRARRPKCAHMEAEIVKALAEARKAEAEAHAAPIVAVLENGGDPRHITELRGKQSVS